VMRIAGHLFTNRNRGGHQNMTILLSAEAFHHSIGFLTQARHTQTWDFGSCRRRNGRWMVAVVVVLDYASSLP
jgi:hypothetical protein